MLFIPGFACLISLFFLLAYCCNFDKRDKVTKICIWLTTLSSLGYIFFCLACLIFEINAAGFYCCGLDAEDSHGIITPNWSSFKPVLKTTTGEPVLGYARTTGTLLIFQGSYFFVVAFAVLLFRCYASCGKDQDFNKFWPEKQRIVPTP